MVTLAGGSVPLALTSDVIVVFAKGERMRCTSCLIGTHLFSSGSLRMTQIPEVGYGNIMLQRKKSLMLT